MIMYCDTCHHQYDAMTIFLLILLMSSKIFLQKTACRLFDRLHPLRTWHH